MHLLMLQNPPPPPGLLDHGGSLGGLKPDQIAIGKIHYNICFFNSPSWWVTMAPNLDLGSKKVTCPH